MTDHASIEAIQQRMQQVRHEMGDEVEDLVASAKDITDWRQYVRANPWACMAAAVAIGFVAVPKRAEIVRLNPADLRELARQGQMLVADKASAAQGGLGKAALSFVGATLLRGLMGYFGQQVTRAGLGGSRTTDMF